jgi:hypothetical protein
MSPKSLSTLNKTNCNHGKFQPQVNLVSLRVIFPSIEFKTGIKYNFSGQNLRINNILELEKYLINKQKTRVLAKEQLPAVVVEDNGKSIFIIFLT